MAKRDKYIVGLDIGSHSTKALIGQINEEGQLDVIGVSNVRSEGVRKGAIVNLDRARDTVCRAIEEAEQMAGIQAESVYANLGCQQIKSVNSCGSVAVINRAQGINVKDVLRVIENARAIPIPQDREIVHAIPQEYTVDDQENISDPIGMTGSCLKANVHIVTASRTVIQNTETCVNRAGYELKEIVASPLAASEAVLTADEKELGVGLLDIGGGTTGIAFFERGSPFYTAVIPHGSDNITSDTSIGLKISLEEAERIKKRYGCAMSSLVGEDEVFEVTGIGRTRPRVVTRRLLSDLIQHRADMILKTVMEEVTAGGFEKALNAGFVLCGGGSALEGLLELGEATLGTSVRKSVPSGVGGISDMVKNPIYAVAVGLLLYGYADKQRRIQSKFPAFSQARAKAAEWFRAITRS